MRQSIASTCCSHFIVVKGEYLKHFVWKFHPELAVLGCRLASRVWYHLLLLCCLDYANRFPLLCWHNTYTPTATIRQLTNLLRHIIRCRHHHMPLRLGQGVLEIGLMSTCVTVCHFFRVRGIFCCQSAALAQHDIEASVHLHIIQHQSTFNWVAHKLHGSCDKYWRGLRKGQYDRICCYYTSCQRQSCGGSTSAVHWNCSLISLATLMRRPPVVRHLHSISNELFMSRH